MRQLKLDGKTKAVIGMVHLGALPGTPFYEEGSFEQVLETAVANAVALDQGGATGCLVQTVDRVYSTADESDPARVAAMALIVREIAAATGEEFQIGVQIMRNAIKASLAVAKVSGGSFLRCGVLVGATITGDGIVEGNPLEVQRYRRSLDATEIKLIAEIDSMHFKWMGGKPVAEVALAARYAGADAVSLCHADEETALRMIEEVRAKVPGMPVFLAGYTNHSNAGRMLAAADGAFVGTCLERGGWGGTIDVDRVRAYMSAVHGES